MFSCSIFLSVALYEESTDSIDMDEPDASRSETSTKRIPLQAVNVITAHIPIIQDARTTVTNQMEALVLAGLETLVSKFRSTALH
jgi:conserved oligomeric Golgi complex subunit 5